jgi:biopolymer transport protein ExbD
MSAWQVRKEGAPDAISLPTAGAVVEGLRDGNFEPTDEVKGPNDADWKSIESHPTFEEAALEAEPVPGEAADDTHLDMNPLIDVCLVLLIFFILTITYASLERALDVPEDTAQEKGASKVDIKDIQDRVFIVSAKMEGEKPVIKMGTKGAMKEVPLERVFPEMQELINTTNRREMVLDIDDFVPWGVETAILDAAKGNKVHNIINNQRARSNSSTVGP